METVTPEVVNTLIAQVSNLGQVLQQLTSQVKAQEEVLTALRPQYPAVSLAVERSINPDVKINLPDRFDGDRSVFQTFKNSCNLYFELRPQASGNERQRVGIIISLLQGDPQAWAFSLPSDDPARATVDAFFKALGLLYDDPNLAATAESRIRALRQGRRSAEDYCSDFRRWAVHCQWNDPALRCQFRVGLSDAVKDALVQYPVTESLEDLMRLAINTDRRLKERRAERDSFQSSSAALAPREALEVEEPMQMGSFRLTPQEKRRRRSLGLCLYCGGQGHRAEGCPRKTKLSGNA